MEKIILTQERKQTGSNYRVYFPTLENQFAVDFWRHVAIVPFLFKKKVCQNTIDMRGKRFCPLLVEDVEDWALLNLLSFGLLIGVNNTALYFKSSLWSLFYVSLFFRKNKSLTNAIQSVHPCVSQTSFEQNRLSGCWESLTWSSWN